jgi:hypothetical protein
MTILRNASGPVVTLKVRQPAAMPLTGGPGGLGMGVWSVLSMRFRPFFAVGAKPLPRLRQFRPPLSHLGELAVKGGLGKGRIVTKELRDPAVVVPSNHWQQHTAPVFRAGVIATSEHDSFHVAELIG